MSIRDSISGTTMPQMLAEIGRFAGEAGNLIELQKFCVRLIAERLPHYNWVGFYMLGPGDPDTLVLGPFVGAPTEHVRIPVSQGICGAAVAQEQTVVVDDVTSDPRYLACSIETKSEIVVPIHVGGRVIGEIDIDSHEMKAFDESDKAFLEKLAKIVGSFVERQSLSRNVH